MPTCPRVDAGCPLFAQFSMKASLAVWQAYYCQGMYERCERWRRVSSGQAVAPNLLPNGRTLDLPLDQLEPRHLQ